MGAVFALTRFSLVRISIRNLVADGKSLVRSSGVGGGDEKFDPHFPVFSGSGRGGCQKGKSKGNSGLPKAMKARRKKDSLATVPEGHMHRVTTPE